MILTNMPIRRRNVLQFMEIFNRLNLRFTQNSYWDSDDNLRVSFELPTFEIQREFEDAWARVESIFVEVPQRGRIVRWKRRLKLMIRNLLRLS